MGNQDIHLHQASQLLPSKSFDRANKTCDSHSESIFPTEDEYTVPQRQNKFYISSFQEYENMYNQSIERPDTFWAELGLSLGFRPPEKPNKIFEYNWEPQRGKVYTHFMKGWRGNVCYSVLDRIVNLGHGEKVAFFWEGNKPADDSCITYNKLLEKVSRLANGLKTLGVKKGEIVVIYMPMLLETCVAMLACARIGAIHSVVFAGFSSEAFADRICDAKVKLIITADGFYRGEKFINLREVCENAIEMAKTQGHEVGLCITLKHLKRLDTDETLNPEREDVDWDLLCEGQETTCPCEWVESEHPLFMLYTSGSSGKPKGILHSSLGYLLFASTVFKYSFNFQPSLGDVFFSTCDIGWACAHTNSVYGPLSLGGTSVIFKGTPFYPNYTRIFDIIQKYGVSTFYTAPTVVRHLMKNVCEVPCLPTLKVLGTVGEPMTEEVWSWFFSVFGKGKCPIIDTYGMTETGGHLLTSIPGATPMKPGWAGFPFFGCSPVILNRDGTEIEGPGEGELCFKKPWPSAFVKVHGNESKFQEYFSRHPGFYCTGDKAERDDEGFYRILGRADETLKISGHKVSIQGVEDVIRASEFVQDVACVATPHKMKGQSLHAFVILEEEVCKKSTIKHIHERVRHQVGRFAVPENIFAVSNFPVSRSGKVVRRFLRNIILGEDFGDKSMLIDESVLCDISDIVNNNH